MELDRLSQEIHESRSRIVETALKSWYDWHLKQELINGYKAMRQENSEMAESNLVAGSEVW
jgi:hypothetical protein